MGHGVRWFGGLTCDFAEVFGREQKQITENTGEKREHGWVGHPIPGRPKDNYGDSDPSAALRVRMTTLEFMTDV